MQYVILFVSRQGQGINKTRMQGERFLRHTRKKNLFI